MVKTQCHIKLSVKPDYTTAREERERGIERERERERKRET
jgi:hypothetical protein